MAVFVCVVFSFLFLENVCLCLVEHMRGGLVCWLEGAVGVVVLDLVPLGLGKRQTSLPL